LTKLELAKLLNVSRQTLSNWEKEKPDLVRLINQGLAFDELYETSKINLEKLEKLKEKAGQGKFKLK
jgi:transcriptional regulator with XRE-family HTH domain